MNCTSIWWWINWQEGLSSTHCVLSNRPRARLTYREREGAKPHGCQRPRSAMWCYHYYSCFVSGFQRIVLSTHGLRKLLADERTAKSSGIHQSSSPNYHVTMASALKMTSSWAWQVIKCKTISAHLLATMIGMVLISRVPTRKCRQWYASRSR